MVTPRYPWANAEAFLARMEANREPATSTAAQARLLNVDTNYIYRWRRDGLSPRMADRVATALGLHPHLVWPEMEADDHAAMSRPCSAGDCTERFIPRVDGGRSQRFCSRRCRERIANRRKRRSAGRREADRLISARYYAENRDYCLAWQRRYDAEQRAGRAPAA